MVHALKMSGMTLARIKKITFYMKAAIISLILLSLFSLQQECILGICTLGMGFCLHLVPNQLLVLLQNEETKNSV